MSDNIWDFKVWKGFNHKIFGSSLQNTDMIEEGTSEVYETNFKVTSNNQIVEQEIQPETIREVIKMEKNGKKYLLPIIFKDELPLKPMKTYRCQLKKSDKKIWHFITQIKPMRIRKDAHNKSFRQFITEWNMLAHTHPRNFTFLKILAIASKYKGLKCCVCSEPNAGKNSNFTLMNCITMDVCRIQKPTLAKMETVIYYNHVILPDEFTSLEASKVRDIEPFILWVGDNSPDYNKHSMSNNKQLDTVDLAQTSMIFTYNRVEDLGRGGKFFDAIWNNISAFKTRYVQFLINGRVLENFSNYSVKQARKVMESNYELMKEKADQFCYWTNYLHKHLNNWNRSKLVLNNRQTTNTEALLDALDVYSKDQEEFDDWLAFINTCISDYKLMIDPLQTGQQQLVVEEEMVVQ